MAAASDLTSQPRDKEEVIAEEEEASVEVADSEVIAEEEEASVAVAEVIATEVVENTELVHSVSDMPIRKF